LDFDFENSDDDSTYSYKDSEEDDNTNTLSFVDTDQIEDPYIPPIELQQQELSDQDYQRKEKEPIMSRNPTSNSVLNPVIAMMKVNDPEYASYDLTHERSVVGTRTDIPAGIDPTNFCSRVLKCGSKIEFIGVTVQSRFDARYTLGKDLVDSPDGDVIVAAFENTLTKDWTTSATTSHGRASTPAEVKSWTVNLPVKVERRPLNPHKGWKPCPPGMQGFVNVVADARSSFYYTFNLVEEDPNIVNPLTSMGGLMHVSYQQESNPMGVVEMQQNRMQNLNLFATAAAHGAVPATVGGGGHRGGSRRGGGSTRSRMSMDSILDTSSSSSSSSFMPPPPPGHRRTSSNTKRDIERRDREIERIDKQMLLEQARYKRTREAEKLAADKDRRAQDASKYGYTASASISKARGSAKGKKKSLFKKPANVSPHDYINNNLRKKYDPRVSTVDSESEDDYEEHTVHDDSSNTKSRSRSRHVV
jgi:hypothetical protein